MTEVSSTVGVAWKVAKVANDLQGSSWGTARVVLKQEIAYKIGQAATSRQGIAYKSTLYVRKTQGIGWRILRVNPVYPEDSPNAGIIKWDGVDEMLYDDLATLQATSATPARRVKELDTDVSNGTNIYADVTGLEIPVVVGVRTKWYGVVCWESPDKTVGIGFAYSGPGTTPTITDWFSYRTRLTSGTGLSAASIFTGSQYDVNHNTNDVAENGGTEQCLAILEGIIFPQSSGLLRLRFRAEVNSPSFPVTIKAGSMLEYW